MLYILLLFKQRKDGQGLEINHLIYERRISMKKLLIGLTLLSSIPVFADCTVVVGDSFEGALVEQIGYTPVYDIFEPASYKLHVGRRNIRMGECSDINGNGAQQFEVYATLYDNNGEVFDRTLGHDRSTKSDNDETRLACASRAGAYANAILKLKRCDK
ncbi:MAG: hypothetical protein MK008_05310 [Bdellovibrionales bacterium]|nr:hypothetical protein [Bdellovibrionales bacterium]